MGVFGISLTYTMHYSNMENHFILVPTAICDFPCYNGGACITPNTCTCQPGWTGYDCTTGIYTSHNVLYQHADKDRCFNPGMDEYPSHSAALC